MADTQTVGRIGEMLKNVYGDAVVEIQNMKTVLRKRFKKAKAVRVGGDHYEFDVRVGGNRGGVGARLSDDPLPTAKRQKHKKATVIDRAVFAVIKLYDKDIANAETDKQSFVNHLDDEMEGVVNDFSKHMNIITYGDGTGMLATVNANTVNTNVFVGATGTSFGQFGTRYLAVDDQIDIYDSTLAVKRTPAGGVAITALEPTTRSVTVSANLTLTATDVVVRADSVNKEYIGLQLASDSSSSVTFQNVSRSTYPLYRGQVVSAGGNAISETYLQQILSLIEMTGNGEANTIVCHNAQWDGYASIGTSLKRFMSSAIDMGFQKLDYQGLPFLKDPDCPPMIIHAFDNAQVQNGVVKALGWLDRDGHTLKWVSGYAAWTAILAEYGNYLYPNPSVLGRVEALQVPSAYLR